MFPIVSTGSKQNHVVTSKACLPSCDREHSLSVLSISWLFPMCSLICIADLSVYVHIYKRTCSTRERHTWISASSNKHRAEWHRRMTLHLSLHMFLIIFQLLTKGEIYLLLSLFLSFVLIGIRPTEQSTNFRIDQFSLRPIDDAQLSFDQFSFEQLS